MVYVYDIECFSNFFSICFINALSNEDINKYISEDINNDPNRYLTRNRFTEVFMVYDQINDIPRLVEFLKGVRLLIGYNNYSYDDLMLDFILKLYQKGYDIYKNINDVLYKFNNSIINYLGYSYRQDHADVFEGIIKYHRSIDLYKLHHLDKDMISLKQVGINLKFYNIKESGVPFDQPIGKEDVSNIIDYNINDVLITHLLWNSKREEFNLRVFVSDKYDLNVLSSSRSGMADKLLAKIYSDATGLNRYEFMRRRTYRTIVPIREIISNKVEFESDILNRFLNQLMKTTLTNVDNFKFEQVINFGDAGYTFATGGLHSIDRPGKFYSTDTYDLFDADVASFYPRIMINEEVCPDHLYQLAFTSILLELTNERLFQKASGNKLYAEALKITINSIFGKLGFEGWLLDHYALFKTTINGQLFLMMLIEDLVTAIFKVISANTDGVLTIVPKDRMHEYNDICAKWMEQTGFTLEFTKYTKYIRTSVNDYLAVTEDDKIKQKGDFLTTIEINKGYFAPIISLAVNNYYRFGTSIDESLRNHNDIYDFCISQKTGQSFINQYHTINGSKLNIEKLQKNIRYYVSNTGGVLLKHHKEDGRNIRLIAGYNCTIFNKFIQKSIKEYNINYNFYKMKCYEMLDKIEGKTKESITGKLFD